MKLYRSIGETELNALLNDIVITGRYKNADEQYNTGSLNNVVCFFAEPIRWKDARHQFHISIEIDDDDKRIVERGVGTYMAAKAFATTKIWTGRKGSVKYELPEAYLSEYSVKDVRIVDGLYRYAKWYIRDIINPLLEKYSNIELGQF